MAGTAQAGAEEVDRKDDERHDDQGQEGQLPIEENHRGQRTDEDDGFLNERNEVAGNSRLKGRDVIGQVAHDITCLMLIKIRQGQGLQMAVQFFADIIDNFLTDEAHEIAFAKVKDAAQ